MLKEEQMVQKVIWSVSCLAAFLRPLKISSFIPFAASRGAKNLSFMAGLTGISLAGVRPPAFIKREECTDQTNICCIDIFSLQVVCVSSSHEQVI